MMDLKLFDKLDDDHRPPTRYTHDWTSDVIFVTGSIDKLHEVQQILGPLGIGINSYSLDNLPEVQGSVEHVAGEKARDAANRLHMPVLTEDSALNFKAMGELPGPYINCFMKELGHEGLNKLLIGFDDKRAEAISTFAYCKPGSEPIIIEGRTHGRIVDARGSNGFGWDAIFEPEGYSQTYAEMDHHLKNSISHRFLAVHHVQEFLDQL